MLNRELKWYNVPLNFLYNIIRGFRGIVEEQKKMVIVELEDGTTYNMDTDSESMARMIVEHKLRNRLDFRKIRKTRLLSGVKMLFGHDGYNSGQWGDREPLKCSSGWSYKWDDGKCAEFR